MGKGSIAFTFDDTIKMLLCIRKWKPLTKYY